MLEVQHLILKRSQDRAHSAFDLAHRCDQASGLFARVVKLCFGQTAQCGIIIVIEFGSPFIKQAIACIDNAINAFSDVVRSGLASFVRSIKFVVFAFEFIFRKIYDRFELRQRIMKLFRPGSLTVAGFLDAVHEQFARFFPHPVNTRSQISRGEEASAEQHNRGYPGSLLFEYRGDHRYYFG